MSEKNRPSRLPSDLYLQATGELLVRLCRSSCCAITYAYFFKMILTPGVLRRIPASLSSDGARISALLSLTTASSSSPRSVEPVVCLKDVHCNRRNRFSGQRAFEMLLTMSQLVLVRH